MVTKHYLTKTQLDAEVYKCLNCRTRPCMSACPVNCCPQEFIQHIKNNDFEEAIHSICKNNPMGHTCGLICPDNFCMKACLRGNIDHPINIPLIQATLIHKYRKISSETKKNHQNGKKIAIVGAGPAGLASTWFLIKQGYKVKIFEKSDKVGGALNLIPDFRLPYKVIEDDWNYIKSMGDGEIEFNCLINNPKNLLSLGFDGVIMAIGEQNSINLGVDGEEYIVSYYDYLKNPAQYEKCRKIAVIGGGNVACDCVLTAKRLGAKDVSMFIRRKIFDMRITKNEMSELLDKQIDLIPTTRITKVQKDNNKFNIYTCTTQQSKNGYTDIENSIIKRNDYDLIIKAIGSKSDKHIDHELIVYAGDWNIGGSTIVEAVASGIDSAKIIDKKLMGEE